MALTHRSATVLYSVALHGPVCMRIQENCTEGLYFSIIIEY